MFNSNPEAEMASPGGTVNTVINENVVLGASTTTNNINNSTNSMNNSGVAASNIVNNASNTQSYDYGSVPITTVTTSTTSSNIDHATQPTQVEPYVPINNPNNSTNVTTGANKITIGKSITNTKASKIAAPRTNNKLPLGNNSLAAVDIRVDQDFVHESYVTAAATEDD